MKLGFWFLVVVLCGAALGSLVMLLGYSEDGVDSLHYLSVFVWSSSLIIWLSASLWRQPKTQRLLLYSLVCIVIITTVIFGTFILKSQGISALFVVILWTIFCVGFGLMRTYELV